MSIIFYGSETLTNKSRMRDVEMYFCGIRNELLKNLYCGKKKPRQRSVLRRYCHVRMEGEGGEKCERVN